MSKGKSTINEADRNKEWREDALDAKRRRIRMQVEGNPTERVKAATWNMIVDVLDQHWTTPGAAFEAIDEITRLHNNACEAIDALEDLSIRVLNEDHKPLPPLEEDRKELMRLRAEYLIIQKNKVMCAKSLDNNLITIAQHDEQQRDWDEGILEVREKQVALLERLVVS